MQDGLRDVLRQQPEVGFTEADIASLRLMLTCNARDIPRLLTLPGARDGVTVRALEELPPILSGRSLNWL